MSRGIGERAAVTAAPLVLLAPRRERGARTIMKLLEVTRPIGRLLEEGGFDVRLWHGCVLHDSSRMRVRFARQHHRSDCDPEIDARIDARTM
jgi:hypothetical protein